MLKVADVSGASLHKAFDDRAHHGVEVFLQILDVVRHHQLGEIEPHHHVFVLFSRGVAPDVRSPEKRVEPPRLVDVVIVGQRGHEQTFPEPPRTQKHGCAISLQQRDIPRLVHIVVAALPQDGEIRNGVWYGYLCLSHTLLLQLQQNKDTRFPQTAQTAAAFWVGQFGNMRTFIKGYCHNRLICVGWSDLCGWVKMR